MLVIKNIYIVILCFSLTNLATAEASQTEKLNLLFKKLSKANNINNAELIANLSAPFFINNSACYSWSNRIIIVFVHFNIHMCICIFKMWDIFIFRFI